jgi:predicted ATP-dependent endonuclease of OLD family
MKLDALILENFRGFKGQHRIPFDCLTVLVGKNDVGKSTVLEALSVFFNEGQIDFDPADKNVHTAETKVRIGCEFSNLPPEIVLDASAKTSLKDELLLNRSGKLEIHKVFDCSKANPKPLHVIVANHPTGLESLFQKTHDDLQTLAGKSGVDMDKVDQRSNVELRRAIREVKQVKTRAVVDIPLEKNEAKSIWEQIQKHLPVYALFRSDRPSQDKDGEVQSPLKSAVTLALAKVAKQLEDIKTAVRTEAEDVAQRTLKKLKEIDGRLAAELKTHFSAEPGWNKLFAFNLTGDNNIPINKRGSGVRRLILLSFFRAEAEKRREENNTKEIIYAIEEPETSQHPTNQKLLADAFSELADAPNTQVILTTHTPGLAGLLTPTSLRRIRQDDQKAAIVDVGDAGVLAAIADELGIQPDFRVQVLLLVEGPHDIEFLNAVSKTLHAKDATVIHLESEPRVLLLPLGGGNLKHWVARNYLKALNKPQVHIYDRDEDAKAPKYREEANQVNARGDGSWAAITKKREAENYLHADAIRDALEIEVTFGPDDDVPLIVAKALHAKNGSPKPWADIESSPEDLKERVSRAKTRLNKEAAEKMTPDRLKVSDPDCEWESWLRKLGGMLK